MTLTAENSRNYNRIEKAIGLLLESKGELKLADQASALGLSPSHYQHIFTDFAGVSPKQFSHFISIHYAKQILTRDPISLLSLATETGLSGTGRLHDLFIKMEAMTPGEFKLMGDGLIIQYSYHETIFGRVLVASTHRGICYFQFVLQTDEMTFSHLKRCFPLAAYNAQATEAHKTIVAATSGDKSAGEIKLSLKGTPFQQKVWQALLRLPYGALTTYGSIARQVGSPAASRAVGTAVGANPVAVIIPCHRVIASSGIIGNYMWGTSRKAALIGREAALRTLT